MAAAAPAALGNAAARNSERTRLSLPSKDFFSTTVTPVIQEGVRLLPDSILLVSGFFALLTLSLPYTAFFGAMVETSLIFNGIKWLNNYLNVSYGSLNPKSFDPKCRTGFTDAFQQASPSVMSAFQPVASGNFPSAPIFMIATAGSYVFNTLSRQAKELEMLGPAYSSRFYISMILLSTFLLSLGIYRLYYGCDGPATILVSAALGMILGAVLVFQNRRLFGEDAINLMGIPLLRNRTADGKPLYICPTRKV